MWSLGYTQVREKDDQVDSSSSEIKPVEDNIPKVIQPVEEKSNSVTTPSLEESVTNLASPEDANSPGLPAFDSNPKNDSKKELNLVEPNSTQLKGATSTENLGSNGSKMLTDSPEVETEPTKPEEQKGRDQEEEDLEEETDDDEATCLIDGKNLSDKLGDPLGKFA
jgi:hypothetical protein